MVEVLFHGGACLLYGSDHTAGQWILRCGIRRARPDDPTAGYLKPRAFETAFIDRIADIDIGVAVAMRAHIARCGEAGAEVGLKIVYSNQCRSFSRHPRLRCVEHVRMRIDQTRQNCCLAQVDDLCAGWNLYLTFRTDVGDAFALKHDDLAREHLTGLAVE